LLIEVAAVTGARVSQLAQLQVQDVQADREAPRLMMPSSRKGRGKKVMQRRPVPIRVVAVNHDTSIAMLERTYSRHISDHADALARAALLDIADDKAGNVVPLHAAQ
jgi:hypothetical protein